MSEDVWFPAFPGAAGEGGRFRRPRYSPADLLAMLWRERVLMTAVFAAFAIAGLLFVVVARTVYPAEAILLVRPAQEPIRRAGAAPWTVTDAQAATQSEAAILTSTPVKQKVIQRIGSGTLFPDLGGDEAEATAQLTRDLKIQISAGSPVIRLSYAHPDPALAARALNTLVEEYLIGRRPTLLTDAAPLATARKLFEYRLDQADEARRDFLSSNRVDDFAGEKASLSELHTALERQRLDTHVRLQDRRGRLGALRTTGEEPDQGRVVLTAEIAGLRSASSALDGQSNAIAGRLRRLVRLEPRYDNLTRDRDGLRDSMRELTAQEQAAETAELVASLGDDNVVVLEHATVPTRGESDKAAALILALVLGAACALGGGFARAFSRRGLPTVGMAARSLGLPVLATAGVKASLIA
jgi:uncharacterized protein involved in exopolysaccharide biosynthesis